MEARHQFGSRLGVILASVGSAVGLGNVWRFPMEAGRSGGAAFILVYVIFVLILALPVMCSEFVVGRMGRANAADSFKRLAPNGFWSVVGYMGVLAGPTHGILCCMYSCFLRRILLLLPVVCKRVLNAAPNG